MKPTIITIPEAESTNNYLHQLSIRENLDEGTTISTNSQTAGRGQRGNSWESEEGQNLAFSILIYPSHLKACEQFIISQLISLAVKETLDKYIEDVTIKWPNDIYWKNKKLAGILIENVLCETHISQSIIGVGININQETFTSDAPNPISLKQITGKNYDREIILEKIVINFLSLYDQTKGNPVTKIVERYKNSLFRNKGFYLYDDGQTIFLARLKDVATNGILVLETDLGVERHFAFKEIKIVL